MGRTLREWYRLSHKQAGMYFREASLLSDDDIAGVIAADVTRAPAGRPRTLSEIRRPGRTPLPSLEDVRASTNSELKLQRLLVHRGFLFDPEEPIIGREIPSAPDGIDTEGWADVLAYDRQRRRPILVEVKVGDAGDPISGVLLELLSHWAFHRRHGIRQLLPETECAVDEVDRIELSVLAPESYFEQAVARSGRRDHDELSVARRIVRCLRARYGIQVRFLAIGDDWPERAVDFTVREWTLPD